MAPHEMIPPATDTQSQKAGGIGAALRWASLIAFGVAGAVAIIALAVVAATAALIGLVVGGLVVLGLRMTAPPRRPRAGGGPTVLEGRHTPDGWVVEAVAPKPH